jgi:hypothetical protein
MTNRQRYLIRAEITIAAVSAVWAVVTLFWRDWIELLFHWDPDHGSGNAEILIVVSLAILAVLLGSIARWQSIAWSSRTASVDAT